MIDQFCHLRFDPSRCQTLLRSVLSNLEGFVAIRGKKLRDFDGLRRGIQWNGGVLHGWTVTRQIVTETLSAGRLCWAQACSHGGNEMRRERHGRNTIPVVS